MLDYISSEDILLLEVAKFKKPLITLGSFSHMLRCVPKLTLVAPLLLWLFLFGTTSHLSCEHVVIAVRHCMA